MDAKELRDKFDPLDSGLIYAERETILRALDLLAAVEGSQDEIVRMCNAASYDDRLADGMLYRRAAAALVAMKAAKEKAEALRQAAVTAYRNLYPMEET